jgi:transposase
MGGLKLTLLAETLNKLNFLKTEFEESRNLGGILRIIAIIAVAGGDSIEKVADLIQTSNETVRNWVNAFLCSGVQSLYPNTSPGRPKTLSDSEVKKLKKMLEKKPEDFDLRGGCWDAKKIRTLLLRCFGKKLSTKYIPELLKNIGLSFKKARVKAGKGNDFLRAKWIDDTWPRILTTAEKQDAHIFFGDEAYFSIFGTSGYTWTLTNAEAIIESTGSKENIHIIGAINFQTGKTHALMTEGKVDEDVFICYLKTLLKETRKPIHLIVDNAGYHKSAKVRAFLETVIRRLTIHYLPPYSPDYNPIEGLWKDLKKDTTHNVYFDSLEALKIALTKGLKHFREVPSKVMALFGFYENLA